jgi:hypothetical protein
MSRTSIRLFLMMFSDACTDTGDAIRDQTTFRDLIGDGILHATTSVSNYCFIICLFLLYRYLSNI